MWIIILTIAGVSAADISVPTISTPHGKIQGTYATSFKGNLYQQYTGIPYAQPPIGDLRFEDPKPITPWDGTWIANFTTECAQITHWPEPEGGKTIGQEDCLHINVYVPGKTPQNNLDVVIHIHGGAFMFGSGLSYAGPKHFMDRNLILVSFNYRIGIFGFLSTEDEHLPGNFGMKDQSMALEWVKNNIEYFGGNKNSITLTGLSAGGASVHFHYMSPLSRNLFNRGISISGCALNPWTIQENALQKTVLIGKAVGCSFGNDNKMLVDCLKTRNAQQLVESTRLLRSWLFNPFSPLALVVDKYSKNPFLPIHPHEALTKGKIYDVQWIATATTSEGLYPAADFALKDEYFEQLDSNWNQIAPEILHYTHTIPNNLIDKVSEKIKKFYLGQNRVGRDTFDELIQLVSDRIFVEGLEQSAKLHASVASSPVHFYQYNYTGEEIPTLALLFTGSSEKYGVCHGDDVYLMFSDPHSSETIESISQNDEEMRNILLDIWINYIKSGKPREDWLPVSKNYIDPINYLYIGTPRNVEMRTADELGHRSFWDRIPFEENARLFENKVKTEL